MTLIGETQGKPGPGAADLIKDATDASFMADVVEASKTTPVIVDFWATWCGPCVAKMPEVKKILEKYKGEGLEVVGISLDQPEKDGGLTKLKEFVAKNGYPWPQFYQGNGWDSEFSTSWGIMSIPNVFIIDRKGNLREVGVGSLEESVTKLLAEKG